MSSSRVRHPILRLEVLAADGTRDAQHRVFCRLQRQSVRVEHCCECVHCDAIVEEVSARVDCTIDVPPLDPAGDPDGESTEVGALLRTGTIVVAESVAVRRALGILHDEGRRSIGIVDDRTVLVGLVHETGFMGGARRSRELPAGAAMSSAVAIHERTPVRTALRMLAASHLREATVIGDDGIPLGVFRDIDGLHWIAVARGGRSREE